MSFIIQGPDSEMGSSKSKSTAPGVTLSDVMSRDWTPAFQMSLKQWRKSTLRFQLGFSTSVSHYIPSREYLTWQWSTQGTLPLGQVGQTL